MFNVIRRPALMVISYHPVIECGAKCQCTLLPRRNYALHQFRRPLTGSAIRMKLVWILEIVFFDQQQCIIQGDATTVHSFRDETRQLITITEYFTNFELY